LRKCATREFNIAGECIAGPARCACQVFLHVIFEIYFYILVSNPRKRCLSYRVFQSGTHSMEINMNSKFVWLSTGLLAATLIAQQASAQATLPANLQADRVAIQQDKLLVQNIAGQLRTDEVAGNAAAVAADRTALRLAQIKGAQDLGVLRQDAQPILQPDQAALIAALTQLHSDQLANNASAVQTDQAAVTAAETQLRTDRETIFGGLGDGLRSARIHR
jgi:hypothetical protein